MEKKKKLTQLRKSVPELKAENYLFITSDRQEVSMQDFQDKDELIVTHNMGRSCPTARCGLTVLTEFTNI